MRRVRKQYFFRPSPQGLLAWDVHRLIDLSRNFPRKTMRLEEIGELDRPWAGLDGPETWRQLIEHIQMINEADLSYPIILAANGEVMDGRHRIARAALLGRDSIECVQFERDPDADHVGKGPDDLSYD